jgi:hypothetical protein
MAKQPIPWREAPTDTLEVVKLLLYAFGVRVPPPFDELRAKDRRMRPITRVMLANAKSLLGIRLEPANEKGLRSWRLPQDWEGRLRRAGFDPGPDP